MPEGVVEWYDAEAGEGRIVRAGRRYTVREADIDRHARWPGARVHFDVDHRVGDVAVAVTQSRGRRSGRHHRRTGGRTGRRWADQRPGPSGARRAPEPGRGAEHRPGELARRWAEAIGARDLESVMRLYAPHAVLRRAGDPVVGPDAIRVHWAESPLLGTAPGLVDDRGDGTVLLRWPTGDDGTRLVIRHGEIEEQWVGEVGASTVRQGTGETTLAVSSSGPVGARAWNHAVDQVSRVVERVGDPVLGATVRLERTTDPARERSAIVTATIDVDGWPVRARAEAATFRDATDQLVARLRDQLQHLDERRLALRHRGAEHAAGEWRHGDRPTQRPGRHPRPVGERRIVRRKTFSTPESTIDEAVFDMESLDHEFFLFADLASGQDALVWRDAAGRRIRFAGGAPEGLEPLTVGEIVVEPEAAPVATIEEARERLDVGPEPWVFFRDPERGRGRVLYRRYDGHYGLITPADEAGDEEDAGVE